MIVLSNQQILGLVRSSDLVSPLRAAFALEYATPARLHYDLPGDDGAKLLLMPAWRSREELGVKLATVVAGNRLHGLPSINGLYVVFNGETGEVEAVLEAAALTALRTAAVSALAANYLAREDARRLLLVGTGVLIPHLAEAHLSVRKGIDEIQVWGRRHDQAVLVARQLRSFGARVTAVEDLEEAVRHSDIVSCATMSEAPLVHGDWLKPGAHVDLVGGFTPAMREADEVVFCGSRVVVDNKSALTESGDLLGPVARGIVSSDAPDLRSLVSNAALARADVNEVTVFKSVGNALSDIAAARHIINQYRGSSPA